MKRERQEFVCKTMVDFNKEIITQRLDHTGPAERVREITLWVIDTREQGIRQALIELGWTPPTQDNET